MKRHITYDGNDVWIEIPDDINTYSNKEKYDWYLKNIEPIKYINDLYSRIEMAIGQYKIKTSLYNWEMLKDLGFRDIYKK